MADDSHTPEQNSPEVVPEAFEFPEVDIKKHREFHLEYDRPYTEKEARSKELALFYMNQFFNQGEAEGLFPHKKDSRDFSSDKVGDMAAIYQRNMADVDDTVEYSSKITKEVKKNANDALHDPLTGLLDRRGFDEKLSKKLEKIQKQIASSEEIKEEDIEPKPIAFFVLDLQGLTEINDRRGHPVGDMVINGAADVLEKAIRKGDIVARIGGDEFWVIICETEPDKGLVAGLRDEEPGSDTESREEIDVIKSFSTRVANITLDRKDKIGKKLGIDLDDLELAIGGVEWDDSKTFDEMYAEADALMFRDKNAKYAANGTVRQKVKKSS